MTTPLMISASFAASGAFAQVSNDIVSTLSSSSKASVTVRSRRAMLLQSTIEEDINEGEELEFVPVEKKQEDEVKDKSVDKMNCEGSKLEKCFANIQLVSPKYFTDREKEPQTPSTASSTPASRATPMTETPSKSLADMVHPVDLSLFADDDKFVYRNRPRNGDIPRVVLQKSPLPRGSHSKSAPYTPSVAESADDASVGSLQSDFSFYSTCSTSSNYSAASTSSASRSSSRRSDRIAEALSSTPQRRSRLASSFQSSLHRNRVAYHLQTGRKGMSPDQIQQSHQLLPRPTIQPKIVAPEERDYKVKKKKKLYPTSIYILLLEPHHKVFEVVPVDFHRDLTVGDVCSKIRTKATDPLLSQPQYMSLCNPEQELAAPMLPVRHLLSRATKHCVLTAVPEGSHATVCRQITTVLLAAPRMNRWLDQTDPFQVRKKKLSSKH